METTMAGRLLEHGVSWGAPGGRLEIVGGGVLQPKGTLQVMHEASTRIEWLSLPRSLVFVTEPHIVPEPTVDLVIGYPTLRGTGLFDIVCGREEYEIEGDEDPCELDDMWPHLEWVAHEYVDELWFVWP